MEIRDVQCTPSGPDPTGAVSAGHITLVGCLTTAELDYDTFIRKRNNLIRFLKQLLVAYANEKLISAIANLQSSRKEDDEPHR